MALAVHVEYSSSTEEGDEYLVVATKQDVLERCTEIEQQGYSIDAIETLKDTTDKN